MSHAAPNDSSRSTASENDGTEPGASVPGSSARDDFASPTAPTIVPRDEHSISRKQLSPATLHVLYGLLEGGFEAFLVGGGVRDLLLGEAPKDFDVATDATPEEVRRLFRHSRIIGRRFRLVHVRHRGEIIEVSTFRANAATAGATPAHREPSRRESRNPANGPSQPSHRRADEGMILRDNVFGSLDEDALRRDFTVNALYYTPKDFAIYDFTNGLDDLRAGLMRVIGDPEARYREDPVRMLRGLRLAAKLQFALEPATEAPIDELAPLLESVPPARLHDEITKLFLGGYGLRCWDRLAASRLLAQILPETVINLTDETAALVRQGMHNTDLRIAEERPVTAGFMFAVLLWPALRSRLSDLESPQDWSDASQAVLADQHAVTAIPRRFSLFTRETWELQPRLDMLDPRDIRRLADHPRFRAGYDFQLLRVGAGDVADKAARWWTRYQRVSDDEQQDMIDALPRRKRAIEPAAPTAGKRRRRKRRSS